MFLVKVGRQGQEPRPLEYQAAEPHDETPAHGAKIAVWASCYLFDAGTIGQRAWWRKPQRQGVSVILVWEFPRTTCFGKFYLDSIVFFYVRFYIFFLHKFLLRPLNLFM